MNKNKISVGVNIILLFSLIVCVFLLTKKSSKKDPVKETVIELLDGMIKETQDGFSEHFKYYEMRTFFIKEEIDSFYFLINQENIPLLMDYYEKRTGNSREAKVIFNTLRSIKDKQSSDFVLMSKLMEYLFIKKVIEETGYLSFFWVDGYGIHVSSKKDTILLGEEYIAEFIQSGSIYNKLKQPIVVLGEDTLDARFGYCKFTEKPQKRGLIKHKGYMTFFHPSGGIIKEPLEFEYYVK